MITKFVYASRSRGGPVPARPSWLTEPLRSSPPVDRRKQGMKHSVLEGHGIPPLGRVLAGAYWHDSPLFAANGEGDAMGGS
jgi:hypothetical protein